MPAGNATVAGPMFSEPLDPEALAEVQARAALLDTPPPSHSEAAGGPAGDVEPDEPVRREDQVIERDTLSVLRCGGMAFELFRVKRRPGRRPRLDRVEAVGEKIARALAPRVTARIDGWLVWLALGADVASDALADLISEAVVDARPGAAVVEGDRP